jgi:5-methylcytosine-specific restriction endonuclease McrBC regulatory subunit McrC
MVLDMQNQRKSSPLPQLLGQQQLKMLDQFTQYYRQGLSTAMKENEVEDTWLSGLFEED